MEFVQFHPTGMVWPPSVRGILITEGVRGDGGTLKNNKGERFMFNYIPEFFKGETADNEDEADRWYTDKKNNAPHRRTCCPRDVVARAIHTEVKAGRGSPHGGVFLDIASRRPAEDIRKRLPSMYHQFKELADVDITKEPMEVGPTCHYMMGGMRVDADTTRPRVPGLFAAGEAPAGMHGSNRLGGNSLSDLLVFGRSAGCTRRCYAKDMGGADRGRLGAGGVARPGDRSSRSTATGGENPYAIHDDLRNDAEPGRASSASRRSSRRRSRSSSGSSSAPREVRVEGGAHYNPGWHTRSTSAHCSRSPRLRAGGARAQGEPRRPHPRGLPVHGRRTGARSTWCCASATARSSSARAAPPDARRAEGPLPGEKVMATTFTMRVFRGEPGGGDFKEYQVEAARAWSCSTRSTTSRPPRPTTSPAAGTARRASAARAAPRSTASRGSCA